jgi:hypothetical protein
MRRTAHYISLILCLLLASACSKDSSQNNPQRVSIAYLWSLCSERSVAIKSDIYIEGHVVANDKLGEKHKSIVIADNTGGIELKIEDEKINSYIPLFSHVELRCSGLHVGREGGKTVVGAPPTSEHVVDRITPDNIFWISAFRRGK